MRQRIVSVVLLAVVVALVLFAVPLAAVVQTALFSQQRLELERAALSAATRVGPDFAAGDPVELPAEPNRTIGIYDPGLRRSAGRGPNTGDDTVRRAAAGVVAEGTVGGELVVAVPITASEHVIGIARAAAPSSLTWSRVGLAWLALTGAAGIALVVAVLVARRQARLLSEPLEELAEISRHIAEGDLTARAEPGRIPEIRRVVDTQNAMVDRLTALLDRERTFSADASHQLRTPLTGLQLGLEQALGRSDDPGFDPRPVLIEAAAQATALQRTIDDLLRATRVGPDSWSTVAVEPVEVVLARAEGQWHGPLAGQGRRLSVQTERDAVQLAVPGRPVTQILNVLLENAVQHGRGEVQVVARAIGDAVAVDVRDEGTLGTDPHMLFERRPPDRGGHGIGLPLARSIAEACHGRLRLVGSTPTEFRLLMSGTDLLDPRQSHSTAAAGQPLPPPIGEG